jgi:hypothetical protein
MVANTKVIKPNAAAQEVVDLLDAPARYMSTGDLGLVGDDDQKETVTAQPIARLGDTPWDLHFVQTRW